MQVQAPFRWDNRRGGFFLSQIPLRRTSPFIGQDEIPLPSEISSEEWNALHIAPPHGEKDLFHTVVYPSGDKVVTQVCSLPDRPGIARSTSVEGYRALGGWPTCQEIIAGADPGPMPDAPTGDFELPPEMSMEDWDEETAALQAEWEASGRTILRGIVAVVGTEARQKCWYPNGNQGSGTSALEVIRRGGYITCEDNWAHICGVSEAEGGSAGNPACPGAEPEPEPEPDAGDGNGDTTIIFPPPGGGPGQEDEPPGAEVEPLPVEDDALTTALTAGGLLAALTGVGLLLGR